MRYYADNSTPSGDVATHTCVAFDKQHLTQPTV